MNTSDAISRITPWQGRRNPCVPTSDNQRSSFMECELWRLQ